MHEYQFPSTEELEEINDYLDTVHPESPIRRLFRAVFDHERYHEMRTEDHAEAAAINAAIRYLEENP